MSPEYRAIIRLAAAHGATVRHGAKHVVLRFPGGQSVTVSTSPGNYYGMTMARKNIERVIKGGP